MKKSIRISGLLSALLFVCGSAYAAGLGKLSVQSALGQPLLAEIELLSISKEELAAVTARLASSDVFRQARVERASALNALQFSVEQRANGQPVVRITSAAPMVDPFLDMLLEINWSTGRIVREYTILLDPPAQPRQEAQSVQKPVSTSAAPVLQTAKPQETKQPESKQPEEKQPENRPAPGKVDTVAAPMPIAAPVPVRETARPAAPVSKPTTVAQDTPAPQAAESVQYGPVKAGDTLGKIAAQVKSGEVTLEQMMAGLYMTNKAAFVGGNMNRLRKGTVLNVPGNEAVHTQFSPQQAARLLRDHAHKWRSYRNKLAEAAQEVPEQTGAAQGAAGKITAKMEDKPVAAAESRDVLKLSKGAPTASAGPDAKTKERLQSLEEDIAAKARALRESQERVSQLERAVDDMRKLLAMKAQQVASAPPPVVASPAPQPAKAPEPVAPKVEPPQPVQPEPPKVDAPVAEPPAPAPQPKPVTAPPVKAPVVVPPPVEEEQPGFASLLLNPLYIGGMLVALLSSGLIWFLMRNKRRRQGLNRFEDSVMTGGDFKASTMFNTAGANTGGAPNTEGSMLLTDFSRLGLGTIDTHEVDPIAEAEVYMAYGRDAQAEEILKEALEKDPARREIALKLLEIYAARKDPLAYETTASELYANQDAQDTTLWPRVAEMGRTIDPENPLYRGTPAALAPSRAAALPDEPVSSGRETFSGGGAMPRAVPQEKPATAKIEALPSMEEPIDFDVPFEEQPAQVIELASPDGPVTTKRRLDPDLSEVEAMAAEDFAIDFDFPQTEVEPSAPASAPVAPLAAQEPQPTSPARHEQTEEITMDDLDDLEDLLAGVSPQHAEEEAAVFDIPDESARNELPTSLPALDLSDIDLGLEEMLPEPVVPAADAHPSPSSLDFAPAAEPVEEEETLTMPSVEDLLEEADELEPEASFMMDMPVSESQPTEAPAQEELAPMLAPTVAPEVEEAEAEDEIDPALKEEVNTKLDLARAYLEMGDQEGAREILEEVAQEGDSKQKAEAQRLLAEAS